MSAQPYSRSDRKAIARGRRPRNVRGRPARDRTISPLACMTFRGATVFASGLTEAVNDPLLTPRS